MVSDPHLRGPVTVTGPSGDPAFLASEHYRRLPSREPIAVMVAIATALVAESTKGVLGCAHFGYGRPG
jgi:hypothetical protein